jgi:hypothetical protein
MNIENILKRLSIIKLLYKIGIEQSQQGEMISHFSILSFHDSIEMFLKLSAENKNKKDCQNFMQYWEKIPELTLKESMRNLNLSRVNLKHKGLLPSKIDIESARVNTSDFFNQNTKIIFDIEFKDVSLFELIKSENIKEFLIKAQNLLNENQFEDSAKNCTIAFYELLNGYKENKSESYYDNPFKLTEKVSFRNSGWGNDKTPIDQKLKEIFDKVNKNFKNLESSIEVLSLGLNYKKYLKFKILEPNSYKDSQGKYIFYESNLVISWNKENCQFMIDFVLDSILKLQEFDFEYKDLGVSRNGGLF